MRRFLRSQVFCPACGRWWCVSSNVGFALWIVGNVAAMMALTWVVIRIQHQ